MTVKTLGRFEILREIGKGAMGVVYLAHDPKIDRKIAIKMISIPPGVTPEEARETRHRFVREAQAAGKLTHPNIITIYDVVEDQDLSYIAMEYIEGVTLEAHTKPSTLLPLSRALSIMAQACSALDYAHKNQVIHRDIKPANLMLMKEDLLKITDFGLAKSPQANLTQAGVLIGTPNYMSPEQISGRTMDGRSDFFSLGVVLYELLTGERPFGGDTISTIIYRILYEEPRPPRILNAKLPPAFDTIVRRALAKEPSQRFQTGAEFVDTLNNYSTYHLRSPIPAAPPTVRVGREGEGPPPAPQERFRRGSIRPVSKPRSPLFAGQPFKIAAFALVLVLAVLFFPRSLREPGTGEQGGLARAPAAPAQDEARIGLPFGPQLPGPAATTPRVRDAAPALPVPGSLARILADPGTDLYLDNRKLDDPVVKLPEGDTAEHTLVAYNGCLEGNILLQGSKLPGEIDMRGLKPKVGELTIDSRPASAMVYVDGNYQGRTPWKIPNYDACEMHEFELRKENYQAFLRTFDGTVPWKEIAETLGHVSLSEIPPGLVRFESMPAYPVEVYLDKKPLPVENGTVKLREGKHTLTLRSPKVFFTASVPVEVTGGKTSAAKVNWPGLGSLTVQAEPSRCKIYVDGEFLDYPPINEHPIAAGTHKIKAILDSDPSQVQEKDISVEAGSPVVQTFTFTP
jgi:hypothetical protein